MNVSKLKRELAIRGLSVEGTKQTLTQRLLLNLIDKDEEENGNQNETECIRIEDCRYGEERAEETYKETDVVKERNNLTINDTAEREIKEDLRNNKIRFNIREIGEMLPNFDPTDGTALNSNQWVQNVEILMEVYKIDERLVLLAAKSKMQSYAAKWYESVMDRRMTWREFAEELRENFTSGCTQAELHDKLRRNIRTKQSLIEYYFEMCQIAKGRLEEENIIYYIIMGINEYKLCTTLKSIKIKNLKELKEHIEWHVKMNGFADINSKPVNNSNVNRNSRSYNMEPSRSNNVGASYVCRTEFNTNKENKNAEVKADWVRQRECYNCFQKGHIASNCTLPRRKPTCQRCKKIGHKEEQCKVKVETSTLYMEDMPLIEKEIMTEKELIIDDDGRLEVKAIINNKLVEERVLIDSGSNVSIIKEGLIGKIKLNPIPDDNVVGINGSGLISLGSWSGQIIINNIIYNVNFRVVSDKTVNINIILGRDFLKLNGINVVKIQNKIDDTNFNKDVMREVINSDELFVLDEVGLDIGDNKETISRSKEVDRIYKENYLEKNTNSESQVKYQAEIRLRENKIVTARPKRLSYYESEELKKLTNDLLESGVIRTSESPYTSRVVMVKKKDNSYRMCINYRPLNKIVERIYYPMPVVEDIVQRLNGKRYFSVLDLRNGFYHVDLKEESKKFTAFVTDQGQFEFNKLPFGYTNSPAHFVKYIQLVLDKLMKDNKVIVFIDDILLATESIEEHLVIMEELFTVLALNHIKLHIGKCHFLKTKIEYLGYNVSSAGITLIDKHVESVTNYPVPTNVKTLQRFIGLVSYFRKFIKNFSKIASPLYELIKSDKEFKFLEFHVRAFNKLKNLLIDRPVLSIYSVNSETQLHTDASSSGYGAVLLQKQKDEEWHPVMFYSRKTTDAESRLHSFELETLALVYAIKRFRPYLFGKQFTVVTDCNALKLTLNKRDMNSKIERWALFLEEFDFEVVHRTGDRMKHVDALSRANIYYMEMEQKDLFLEKIYIRQLEDENIMKLKKQIQSIEVKGYEIRDGIVYRKNGQKLQLMVPEKMVGSVIHRYHDNMGHMGCEKTCEVIRRQFYFTNMKDKLVKYIKNCIVCISYNPKPISKEALLHLVDKGYGPFETLHLDHLGPLEKTSRKNMHVLSAVDAFTKYTKLFPTRTTNTAEVCRNLKTYFTNYSVPNRIVTDRGTAFTSKEFEKFMKEKGIVHVKIATASPNSNGQVERYNRTVVPLLAKLTYEFGKQWDTVLDQVEYVLNNTKNKSINEVPSKVLFGVIQRSSRFKEVDVRLQEESRNITSIRENVRNAIEKQAKYNKDYYDAKVRKVIKYMEGSLVMIRASPIVGVNNKLRPKFKGPYKVYKVLDKDRYLIKDIEGYQVSGKHFEGILDSRNMRMYSNEDSNEVVSEDEYEDVEHLDSDFETEYINEKSRI